MATKHFGTIGFKSNWGSTETIDEKADRLDELVSSLKAQDLEVVLVGMSAGGGFSEYYELTHPGKINHIYSLDGTLDTKVPGQKLEELAKKYPSFQEMMTFNNANLTPENIEKYQLDEKTTAYYSKTDSIVPKSVAAPSWVKGGRISAMNFPAMTHVAAIGTRFVNEIATIISEAKEKGQLPSRAPGQWINQNSK